MIGAADACVETLRGFRQRQGSHSSVGNRFVCSEWYDLNAPGLGMMGRDEPERMKFAAETRMVARLEAVSFAPWTYDDEPNSCTLVDSSLVVAAGSSVCLNTCVVCSGVSVQRSRISVSSKAVPSNQPAQAARRCDQRAGCLQSGVVGADAGGAVSVGG